MIVLERTAVSLTPRRIPNGFVWLGVAVTRWRGSLNQWVHRISDDSVEAYLEREMYEARFHSLQ